MWKYIIYKYAHSIIPKQTNYIYCNNCKMIYLENMDLQAHPHQQLVCPTLSYHTLSLSNVSSLLTGREALVDSVQRHGRGFVQSKVKEEYNNTLTVQGLQSASLGSWFPVQLRLYDHCRYFLHVFWGCYGLGENSGVVYSGFHLFIKRLTCWDLTLSNYLHLQHLVSSASL